MKIFIIISVIFLSTTAELPGSLEKKARKIIKQSYNSDHVIMERIQVGTSFDERPSPGIILYELLEKDSLAGYLLITTAKGRHEYFDYLVIYNPDLKIRMIRVLEYRSDHGYEILNKKWLNQFEGRSGCDLEYGTDIDAISGATFSASSITYDVGKMCRFIELQMK